MNTSDYFEALLPPYKKIDLVKKIAEKTRQGKIVWQKTVNGVAAYVPGALRMNFVEAPWPSLLSGTNRRWVIFAVRDEAGNELLKVENQSSAPTGLLSGLLGSSATPPPPPPEPSVGTMLSNLALLSDPLTNVVAELYNIVENQQGKTELDKAIDFLDKL